MPVTLTLPEEVVADLLTRLNTEVHVLRERTKILSYEIKKNNETVNTDKIRHRMTNKMKLASRFSGLIRFLPDDVKTEAKRVRNDYGYSKGIEFVTTWKKENAK